MLVISLLLQYLFVLWVKERRRKRRRRRNDGEPPDFDPDVGDGYSVFNTEQGVSFVPPMRYQRIAAVRTLLADPRWNGKIRKVADLGCGEFPFSVILKDLPAVEEYCAMDYMEFQLREKLLTLSLLAEHLRAKRQRAVLTVLAGSLAEPDDRLVGSDAVICIEVIEHLYPDVLECVPHVVFGCVRPRVAIFSTPNFEFNFLFGDARKFRDTDHKFEWTRSQFKCWASNIVSRYPEYSVEYYGVGRGPLGTTHVGCCTQLALFHRQTDVEDSEDVRCYGEPYKLVHQFVAEPLPLSQEDSLHTELILQEEQYSENGSGSSRENWDKVGDDKSEEESHVREEGDDWMRQRTENWDPQDYGRGWLLVQEADDEDDWD